MSDGVGGAPAKKGFLRRLWGKTWFRILLLALAVTIPAATAGGMAGWKYIKTDPDFCVKCHLMKEPGEKWRHSAHKDVACQTCHRADIFEEMSLGYAAFIERPEKIGPHTKMPHTICVECHASEDTRWKQIAETPGHKTHAMDRAINCLDCHAQKLHEFAADVASCERCHGGDSLKLKGMSELHCLGCHDFAGKKWSNIIPTAMNCRECHPAAPLAEGVAKPALMGKAAPVGKGHEDCMGCHDPHGEKLRDPIDCLACHTKLLDASNAHYKDERISNCRECHEPHEAQ